MLRMTTTGSDRRPDGRCYGFACGGKLLRLTAIVISGVSFAGGATPATVSPGGPTSNGFDHFFGISASLDMPPYAFIENDRFTEAPTAVKNLLILTGDRPFVREGPAAPGFESEQVLPALAKKSVEWIKQQADLMRTVAEIVGVTLPDNAGEDSFSLLPLLNSVDKPVRDHAVNSKAIKRSEKRAILKT